LDPVTTRSALDPVEKMTDCELFEILASELISPNIQIDSTNEADKAARDISAPIISAFRTSTREAAIWKGSKQYLV
jgi:hypothetical protein